MKELNISKRQAERVVKLWMHESATKNLIELSGDGKFGTIASHLVSKNSSAHSSVVLVKGGYKVTTTHKSVLAYLSALSREIKDIQDVCAVQSLGADDGPASPASPMMWLDQGIDPFSDGSAGAVTPLVEIDTQTKQSQYVNKVKGVLSKYGASLRGYLAVESVAAPSKPFSELDNLATSQGLTPEGSRLFFDRIFVPILRNFQQEALQWPRASNPSEHIVASRFILSQLIQVYVTLLTAETPAGYTRSSKKHDKIESAKAMSKEFCNASVDDGGSYVIRNFGR